VVEHAHITRATLHRWILKSEPLHPAFEYLSPVHQSDYLRCYLLHFHGAVTLTSSRRTGHGSRTSLLLCARPASVRVYTEIGPHGVSPVGGALERRLKANVRQLIGCCAFAFHPRLGVHDSLVRTCHSRSRREGGAHSAVIQRAYPTTDAAYSTRMVLLRAIRLRGRRSSAVSFTRSCTLTARVFFISICAALRELQMTYRGDQCFGGTQRHTRVAA